MNVPSGRRVWPVWVAVLGFWSLLAVISATGYMHYVNEMGRDVSWWRAFLFQGPGWYVWALWTPIVVGLGRRFPLERGRWARSLAVHIPAGLVLSLLQLVAMILASRAFSPRPETTPILVELVGYASALLHVNLLIYGAILGAGYAVDYARRYRDRERQAAALEVRASQLQAQLASAQLRALRMQLDPHFLFNALNAVSTLVREGENPAAVRMIAALADLLRRTLDAGEAQEVRLEEEIELLGQYLEIERIRFRDRLRVSIDVADDVAHARVPTLILQPLVENAIRHGIAARASAGHVVVRARRVGELLELQVHDDGPGLHPGWSAERVGVGLANTRARLETLHPGNDRLTLENAPGGGTIATVAIPFRLEVAQWEGGR